MRQHPRTTAGRLLAGMVACTLVLAACGGTSSTSSTGGQREAPPPREGGTLRYGIEGETSGLNPTNDAFAASGLLMARAVFDPLAAYDRDGVPHPYLAERFTHNDRFTAWDVRVRSGVRFHDGTLLDARAVRANLERQIADPLVGLALAPLIDAPRGIEVLDARTVRIHLAAPDAHFPSFLTGQFGLMGSPKWLAAAEEDPSLDQRPVGTGPFKFESRLEDGSTTFVRNDDWWNGRAYLDEVQFIIQTDPGQRTNALLGQDTDITVTDHPTEIERLRRAPGVVNHEDELGEELFVMLNTAKPPFDDLRARKALALATPRQQYNALLGAGIVTPADSIFHPDSKWWTPGGPVQEADDPAAARVLARSYCADVPDQCDGDRIRMEYKFPAGADTEQLTADLLDDGWKAAFVVSDDATTQERMINEVAFGAYQSVLWRQFGDPDPEVDRIFIDCASIGPVSLNWPRYCDPQEQRALDEQRATTDFARRRELWATVVQRMHDGYAYVFLSHSLWDVASRDDVFGVGEWTLPDGSPGLPFANGVHDLASIYLAP